MKFSPTHPHRPRFLSPLPGLTDSVETMNDDAYTNSEIAGPCVQSMLDFVAIFGPMSSSTCPHRPMLGNILCLVVMPGTSDDESVPLACYDWSGNLTMQYLPAPTCHEFRKHTALVPRLIPADTGIVQFVAVHQNDMHGRAHPIGQPMGGNSYQCDPN